MQVSAGQDGIQRLLAAEQEAQKIVATARKEGSRAELAARKAKADRLRQAKQEAEREVKTYKAQREEQYQKRIADDSSNSGTTVKRLEADALAQVKGIEKSIAAKKREVVDTLMEHVTKVKLAP